MAAPMSLDLLDDVDEEDLLDDIGVGGLNQTQEMFAAMDYEVDPEPRNDQQRRYWKRLEGRKRTIDFFLECSQRSRSPCVV